MQGARSGSSVLQSRRGRSDGRSAGRRPVVVVLIVAEVVVVLVGRTLSEIRRKHKGLKT